MNKDNVNKKDSTRQNCTKITVGIKDLSSMAREMALANFTTKREDIMKVNGRIT